MFSWMWIFGFALWMSSGRGSAGESPNFTTCEDFERGARFNPYHVIDSMWKIFYFWADNTELYPIIFALAAKKKLQKVKASMESIEPGLELEWDQAVFFMNPRPGTEVLFFYAGTPGAFRALIMKERREKKVRPYPPPLTKLADVRMKMVGNYIGMMCCEDLTAYALARMDNMPLTETHCEEIAKRLGFKGRKGQSYIELHRQIDDEL